MSNAEFVASFSQERNGKVQYGCRHRRCIDKNTISACAWGAERDGRTGGKVAAAGAYGGGGQGHIPRNAVVVGTGKIQGERLDIEIDLAGIRRHDYPGGACGL